MHHAPNRRKAITRRSLDVFIVACLLTGGGLGWSSFQTTPAPAPTIHITPPTPAPVEPAPISRDV